MPDVQQSTAHTASAPAALRIAHTVAFHHHLITLTLTFALTTTFILKGHGYSYSCSTVL